jgi:hypothetical protein
MPLIPTFSNYAQKPELASAWQSGQNLVLERQKLAEQAAESAARISLGYAQLHADMVKSEMANTAQKEIATREALFKQQQLEVDKAYKQQMASIAAGDLQRQEKALGLAVEKATRESNARAMFQTLRNQYRKDHPDWSEQEITARAMLDAGPEDTGMPASSVTPWMTPQKPYNPAPEETTSASGNIYNRQYPGGPWTHVASPGAAASGIPLRSKNEISNLNKELLSLKAEEQQMNANHIKIAEELERGSDKGYNKLGTFEQAAVDRVIRNRKRIREVEDELDSLYSALEGPPTPATGSNRPRILRKTARP